MLNKREEDLKPFPIDLGTLESAQALFLLLAYRNFEDQTGKHIVEKLWSIKPVPYFADDELVEWGVTFINKFLSDFAEKKSTELESFSIPPVEGGYEKRRQRITEILWEQEKDSANHKQAKRALRVRLWRELIRRAGGALNETLKRLPSDAKEIKVEAVKTIVQYQYLIIEAMKHQVMLDREVPTTQEQLRAFYPRFDFSTGPLGENSIYLDLFLHCQPSIKVSCAPKKLAIRGEGDDASVALAPAEDEGTPIPVTAISSYIATTGEEEFFKVVFGCNFAQYARGTQPQPDIKHGCYGITGERGAGKSSMLRKLRTALSSQGRDVLTFLISIPREFEDREFLFAFLYGLCEAASKASAAGWWRQTMLPVVSFMRDLWHRKLWLFVLAFGIYLVYLTKMTYDDMAKYLKSISDLVTRYRVGLAIGLGVLLIVGLVLLPLGSMLGSKLLNKIVEIKRLKLYFSMHSVMAELDSIRRIEEPGGIEFVMPLLPKTTTEVNPMRYSIPLLNQRIVDVIQEVNKIFRHVVILVDDLDKLNDAQTYEALKNFRAFAALPGCLIVISCPYSIYLQFTVFKESSKDKTESDTVFADMFRLENLDERVGFLLKKDERMSNDVEKEQKDEVSKRICAYIAAKLLSPRFGQGILDILMELRDPETGSVVLDQEFWKELGVKGFYNRRETVRIFSEVFQNWLGKDVRSDLEPELNKILGVIQKEREKEASAISSLPSNKKTVREKMKESYQKKSTFGLLLTAYDYEHRRHSKDALQRRIRATEGFKPLEPLSKILAAKRGDLQDDPELKKLKDVLERHLLSNP